jgi:hypothetical protein
MLAPEKRRKEVLFTQENKRRGRKRKKWNDVEEEKERDGRRGQDRDAKKEIRKERNSALRVIIFFVALRNHSKRSYKE